MSDQQDTTKSADGQSHLTNLLGVVASGRACTCSAEDEPPQPCAEQYALRECRAEDLYARLENERKYWMEVAAGYAQELSGYTNDYRHPISINGVELDMLEKAVREGYQTTAATQLDMISFVRRIMTPNK